MLYEATHTHPDTQCPLQSAKRKVILNSFSQSRVKKRWNYLGATYMSCPQETAVDHKGFFMIDA